MLPLPSFTGQLLFCFVYKDKSIFWWFYRILKNIQEINWQARLWAHKAVKAWKRGFWLKSCFKKSLSCAIKSAQFLPYWTKRAKSKKRAKFNNVNKEWFFVHHRKLFFWQIDALVLKLTMDKMDAHTIAHGLKKNAFPSLVSNHFLLQTIFKAFNMTLIAKLPNSSLSTLWFEKKLGFYFDEFLIVC